MFDHETELPGELEDAEERDRVLKALSEMVDGDRPTNEGEEDNAETRN